MDWRKRKKRRRIMQHYGCSSWKVYCIYLRMCCAVEKIKRHEKNNIIRIYPSIDDLIEAVKSEIFEKASSIEISFAAEDQYKDLDPAGYAAWKGVKEYAE